MSLIREPNGTNHSSLKLMLVPIGNELTFWAPCLKNVLAKVSKIQLRKPAPVIEILPL